MTGYWTPADAAELDVLLWEIVAGYFHKHRRDCVACQPGECTVLVSYLAHRDSCWRCENAIKVSTELYGDPCPRYLQHVSHGDRCARCNPCPHVRKAVEAVVDWREARQLRSKAEWLRWLETDPPMSDGGS